MTAGWRVELTGRARRDLRRLDRPIRERVLDAVDRVIGDPPQGELVRLSGRLRVGDWRVRCELDAERQVVLVCASYRRARVPRLTSSRRKSIRSRAPRDWGLSRS